MQIWAESGKSALPICNYSQILYQFLTFTQNLKRSPDNTSHRFISIFIISNNSVFISLPPKITLKLYHLIFSNLLQHHGLSSKN